MVKGKLVAAAYIADRPCAHRCADVNRLTTPVGRRHRRRSSSCGFCVYIVCARNRDQLVMAMVKDTGRFIMESVRCGVYADKICVENGKSSTIHITTTLVSANIIIII